MEEDFTNPNSAYSLLNLSSLHMKLINLGLTKSEMVVDHFRINFSSFTFGTLFRVGLTFGEANRVTCSIGDLIRYTDVSRTGEGTGDVLYGARPKTKSSIHLS